MNIYIASHSQEDAKRVGSLLEAAGHKITSTWLKEDFSRTSSYTPEDRKSIADKDIREVLESDALVLLPSPYRIPGGKFVEVGAALGSAKPVFILGVRENMLMYHTLCQSFDTVESLIKKL